MEPLCSQADNSGENVEKFDRSTLCTSRYLPSSKNGTNLSLEKSIDPSGVVTLDLGFQTPRIVTV